MGFRLDALNLQNMVKFLSLKNFLNLKNFIGINLLHQNISQINLCELGLSVSSQHCSYKYKLNTNF